jgi:hypothetical protein
LKKNKEQGESKTCRKRINIKNTNWKCRSNLQSKV